MFSAWKYTLLLLIQPDMWKFVYPSNSYGHTIILLNGNLSQTFKRSIYLVY